MKYLIKIIKYLGCVGIVMMVGMLFLLFFTDKGLFGTPYGIVDIPIYLGLGWMVYQYIVNRIHEQGLFYYWMIAKLTLQASAISFTSLAIMIKLFG